MKKKTTRAAVMAFATALSLGGMATTASATTYWECVKATWDVVGCALNPDYQEWEVYSRADVDDKTRERIVEMQKSGFFKEIIGQAGKMPQGPYERLCEMNKVLDILEDTGSLERTVSACYGPIGGKPTK